MTIGLSFGSNFSKCCVTGFPAPDCARSEPKTALMSEDFLAPVIPATNLEG